MLYSSHFYNGQSRKYILGMVNLLRNINVVRTDANGDELNRERVPIAFASKEKFVQRYIQDKNLDKEIAIKLPRISVDLAGVAYAPERKLNHRNRVRFQDGEDVRNWSYTPMPYDFDFEVGIYTKSHDEAFQIIEQILPFFTPDYTVTMKLVDNVEDSFDIPYSLVGVAPAVEYEGTFEDRRVVMWNLSFTAKGMMFGPRRTSSKIKAVITNLYDQDTNQVLQSNVSYGTDANDITTILDWDGSDIPGVDTPVDSGASNPNVLAITQGSAFSDSLILLDESDDPVNLTGATVRAWMRRNISSADFTDFTVVNTTPETSGEITLSLTTAQTGKLSPGSYIYEIEIDRTDGSVERGTSGVVTVSLPALD